MSPTVVCVLRSGGDFNTDHVRALYHGVRRWWPDGVPLRFVALTDRFVYHMPNVEQRRLRHSYPGWWAKMEMFMEAQDDLGDIIYFDLDTMVVGSLADAVWCNQVTLLQDFYAEGPRLQSGLMFLPLADRRVARRKWESTLQELVARALCSDTVLGKVMPYRGDGEFLHDVWFGAAQVWQDLLPGQVLSYKLHVKPNHSTIPTNARVICFHGNPRPWTVIPLWEEYVKAP